MTSKSSRVGKRPRTWLALTAAGRRACAGHLDALRAIAGPALASTAARASGGRRAGPAPRGVPRLGG